MLTSLLEDLVTLVGIYGGSIRNQAFLGAAKWLLSIRGETFLALVGSPSQTHPQAPTNPKMVAISESLFK